MIRQVLSWLCQVVGVVESQFLDFAGWLVQCDLDGKGCALGNPIDLREFNPVSVDENLTAKADRKSVV